MWWLAALQAFGMLQQQNQGQENARLLRAQGRTAQQQSVADADSISREYRQLAGRQAAAIAQGGGSYEGSAAKVLHQSESLAFLDRLNTLYHGQLRGLGLGAEARATSRSTTANTIGGLAQIGSDLYTYNRTRPQGA